MSATPDPETDYLKPNFDPNSLVMPKLRGILNAHNISVPSSAKKGQLVDLFEQEVRPQAKRLLSARSRTKPSSRGIVDVPSSAEPSVDGEQSEDDSRANKTPGRTSRRLPRMSVEDDSPERRSTITRSSRASSAKFSAISDADSTISTTGRKSSAALRRTRQSTGTPSVKLEEESEEETPRPRETSAFTSENVFQSGSSPIPDPGSAGNDRRRGTTGGATTTEKKRSSSSRRRTDGTTIRTSANGRAASPTKRTRVSMSRELSHKIEHDEDHIVDTGEEFTPEEQESLALAQADGTVALPVRKIQRASRGGIARMAPLVISLAMLGGLATIWRQGKIAVGFCGIGQPSAQLAGIDIPDWARDVVQPQCEPCPSHAFCYSDLQASCEDGFVLVPHPLALGGAVPLPPTCEPDGEKARRVQAVADRAVEELRERNAKFECGELRDENGRKAESSEVKEEVLKAQVSSKRRKGMSQEEFEELWHSALGELMDRDEIITDVDSTDPIPHRKVRSTSLARVSLSCAIRRSLRLALARHLSKLIAVLILFATSTYAYISFTSSREMETRAKQLAGFALDRLAQQASWTYTYADDTEHDSDAFLGVAQLRDDVLRDEFSAGRRRKLWERVQKKVEENANVRSMVREDRSGEVGRVWQWIGAVGTLEGVDASAAKARRKSGRVSFGPILDGRSAGGSSPLEMSAVSGGRWDEGRPIY